MPVLRSVNSRHSQASRLLTSHGSSAEVTADPAFIESLKGTRDWSVTIGKSSMLTR